MSEPENIIIDRLPYIEIIDKPTDAQPPEVVLFNTSANEAELLAVLNDPAAAELTFKAYQEKKREQQEPVPKKVREDKLTAAGVVFAVLERAHNGKLLEFDPATWGAVENDPRLIGLRDAFHTIKWEGDRQEQARRRIALQGLAICLERRSIYKKQNPEMGTDTAA